MKKNYLNALLVLLVATLMFTGCKKDDEKPASNVNYDGTAHALVEGDYISEQAGELYYINIGLYGQGESLEDMFSVAWVDFSIVSSTEGIQPGTYTFDESGLEESTWIDGSFGIGFEGYDFISGELKIEKSGSTYTVTFTGKTEEDKDITVTYSGAISLDTDD